MEEEERGFGGVVGGEGVDGDGGGDGDGVRREGWVEGCVGVHCGLRGGCRKDCLEAMRLVGEMSRQTARVRRFACDDKRQRQRQRLHGHLFSNNQ